MIKLYDIKGIGVCTDEYLKSFHKYSKQEKIHEGKEIDFYDYKGTVNATYKEAIDYLAPNRIMNNNILGLNNYYSLEVFNGEEVDEKGNFADIYHTFIITYEAAQKFKKHIPDTLIYEIPELNMYILCVTHFGTEWECVKQDIEL